jgi:CDP-4-dehydro-6-deoxyglucose reductase
MPVIMKKELLKSKIVSINYLTDTIVVIGFAVDFDFKAGQFFHIILDNENPDDEIKGFRPYSILNSPDDAKSRGIIETCIRLVDNGYASGIIKNFKVGQELFLRGPHGRFLLEENKNVDRIDGIDGVAHNNYVMIASGTGIVPFISMITQNIHSGKEFTLIFTATTKKELLFYDILKSLEKNNSNFHYFPTLTRESDAWNGLKGRIQHNINHIIQDYEGKTFYICGLKEFIIDIKSLLVSKGVPGENIIFERYS